VTEATRPRGSTVDDILTGIGQLESGTAGAERRLAVPLGELASTAAEVAGHGRFITLAVVDDPRSLVVAIAVHGEVVELISKIEAGTEYPAVSSRVRAAAWAERLARDTSGIEPIGLRDERPIVNPDADAIEPRLSGADAFVMPYGPVRSGVFEAIQFVIETGGEDIPLLDVRTGFKRRELEARMRGMPVADAAVVAERVAGISSVAHALAYAQAVERALDVTPPRRAQLWRVIHAELERIANHLHCAAQLSETTALNVGVARFTILKEDVMRLRAELCGSRFGRGVIVPGGVTADGALPSQDIAAAVDRLDSDLRRDRRLLVGTSSFTDRLFGTGHLPRELAERYAVVGPVARGSGVSTDARFERPYGAYDRLGWELVTRDAGDAMARLEVRLSEVAQSIHIVRQALDGLAHTKPARTSDLPGGAGVAWGWAEAAQGELLYRTAIDDGRVTSAHIASPSHRNWQVFSECFPRDVLTDFGFIEHSFQITPAGADR
jgi:formate hydrogenlyase subunit 5